MRRFWDSLVRPVLEAVDPSAVVEIGAAEGRHTRLLAAHCRERGATLHVIDPVVQFDVDALVRAGGVVMHTDLSLNVLPRLPAVDVALVDGDHNWYTVLHELRLLQQAAREAGRPTPVILCHDAGWPYGRRDLYSDPETIPAEFRHPWARRGMVRGERGLVPEGGLNAQFCNAVREGGPRNGVLTAIEDFVAETDEPISVYVSRDHFGVAVLLPQTRTEALPQLEQTVSGLLRKHSKTSLSATVKEQRIPRVIHRLWLGPDPIPELFEEYAESWARHHPDWEQRLWRDDTLPPLSCQAEYERATDFRVRYDIVRLELLRQFGGVIVDMDVEAIRPLDPLLPGISAFAGRLRRNRIGSQVLGAVPHHPLFEHAVTRLRATVGVADSPSHEAGPAFLTQAVAECGEDVTVFPRETFYSPLTIEPPRRPDHFPEIYAVHHELQSYLGPEARLFTFQRRLELAQREIRRLSKRLSKAETLRYRARRELGQVLAERERLEQELAEVTRALEQAADRLARLDVRTEPALLASGEPRGRR